VAERVYAALEAGGISVLFDDRGERPGVQFADADLIGLPVRLTVSERSLKAGGIELKRRDGDEARVVAEDALVREVRAELDVS
jgi:prolyl-tRNA synthetase